MKKIVFTLCAMTAMTACGDKVSKIAYPESKQDQVVDTYFGTEVADPYRWLENDTTQEVAEWVETQNVVTQDYLSQIPFRSQLKERFTVLANYEKIGTPSKKHGHYYFFKNDGLQNQSVLYVKETLDGEASVLLDPNALSADGTVALQSISFSKNGKYMAYTISRNGSDWVEIFVLDLATNKLTADHVKWAKFSSAEWCGNGFFYSAYDAPSEGKEYSNVNEYHKIYYHELGTPQSEDELAYYNPNYPKRFYRCSLSEDENMLFLYESGEGRGNALYVKDLRRPKSDFVAIATDMDYEYSPVEVIGKTIYFYTNYGAPKYKLMTAHVASPALENWKDLIPETENVLSGISFIGGKMVLTYSQDASTHAYVYNYDGSMLHKVELPTLGSVGFSGNKDDAETFYSFSSFTFPNTIYKYDLAKNTSEKYLAPKVAFDSEDFATEQIFFASKDGTKVPMFITYKKGLKRNGNNPVYLYGYGGFNISLFPTFSTWRIPFLESGGIYAQVNLRGGGEYGEAWHVAGTQMQKQNVFDDFISAAEYLIAEEYTNNDKICIAGGSNGGLLVGAVANQRPDLFRAALPAVGVMDMLRYHKFTIGWNWASDYGTSEDSKEMFEYLLAYSPVHSIKNDGTAYPAILVTTADHDDRVVPAHSFKYAAALQAANTGTAPKLIRIDVNAGHGAGKPISKIIDEYTDTYSFAMFNLGMEIKE